MQTPIRKFDLEERLIDFAVSVIKLVEDLPKTRTANHLGDQLLRSSTSPALNYGEAQGAESKKDFIHKMGIILKELRESKNNLKIMSRVGIVNGEQILKENSELIAIFTKSIETAKANL
jgi:four helix bundle protein